LCRLASKGEGFVAPGVGGKRCAAPLQGPFKGVLQYLNLRYPPFGTLPRGLLRARGHEDCG